MKFKIIVALGLAVLIQSCIPSIHPLYTKDTIVFDESILGNWKDDGAIWTFEKGEKQSYKLTIATNDPTEEMHYRVYLVKLDKYHFMDFIRVKNSGSDMELDAIAPLLPTHSFAKMNFDGNEMDFHLLDESWLKNLFEQRKIRIKHEEMQEGHILLTAPTEDLQKFMVKYAEEEGAFEEGFSLKR